jgi:hypothetical protein
MAELHMPHASDPHGHPRAVLHETSDANVRGVFAFAIGLTVAIVFIGFGVWGLFQYFAAREARATPRNYPLAVEGSRLPPEPRLQTNPRQDLSDLRAREEQQLTSYGWIDKNAGIVRIPIDRAMQLTVERGLPTRAAAGDKQ